MAIKAMLVEDDDFTRLMIASTLKSQGLELAIETASPTVALAEANRLNPQLAILDLHLGKGPTGIDLALALRRDLPKIGILILTSFEDPRLLNPNLPQLPYGSVYLNKKQVTEIRVLTGAIATCLDPKTWHAPAKSKSNTDSQLGDLSSTQIEILRLMAQGYSNSEIAKRRFVTERSQETAIARLAKAMGVSQDSSKNQRVHMAKVYFRSLGTEAGQDDF
jgi:DNA-binding NarL/FixJ family response regulator